MSKYIFILLASIGLLAGCSKADESSSADAAATTGGGSQFAQSAMAPSSGGSPSAKDDAAGAERNTSNRGQSQPTAQLVTHNELPRQVVKTGTLTIQAESVDKAEKQTHKIADGIGGRVDKVDSTDLAGPNPTITMTLRVPAGSFDGCIDQLEKLGVRLGKTVAVEDVTEKIVDMDARLKTMAAQEQALRNMLARTQHMDDTLAVNREITDLREQIESMTAQRKSLGGLAAFSTITLTLQQKPSVETVAQTDPNWLQSSWAGAWGAGTNVFRNVVSVLVWLLVFSPVWILGILILRWLIKAANRPSPKEPSSA